MYKDRLFLENSETLINLSQINKEENINDNIKINKIELNNKEAKTINRRKGLYTTISFNKDALKYDVELLIDTLVSSLKESMNYLKIKNNSKILFVGIGSKSNTIDKLGKEVIDKIVVDGNTYKIHKDVEKICNINTLDFIKSLKNCLNVDLVILIDSLICTNQSNLGQTIQLSTSGLDINMDGKKYELSKNTIKKNVIAIGIPTIIDLKNISEDNPRLLVTTIDIDEIIDNMSSIISIAINKII